MQNLSSYPFVINFAFTKNETKKNLIIQLNFLTITPSVHIFKYSFIKCKGCLHTGTEGVVNNLVIPFTCYFAQKEVTKTCHIIVHRVIE